MSPCISKGDIRNLPRSPDRFCTILVQSCQQGGVLVYKYVLAGKNGQSRPKTGES